MAPTFFLYASNTPFLTTRRQTTKTTKIYMNYEQEKSDYDGVFAGFSM
jgi:hypothetical protein